MLPTNCKESKDDHTCAHHIGVRILLGTIRWLLLGMCRITLMIHLRYNYLTSREKCRTIQMTPNEVTSRS